MLFCAGDLHVAILNYVPQVPLVCPPPSNAPADTFYLHLLRSLHLATSIQFMNFESWLDELIGEDTRATASKKADYAQSTISRQLSRGHLRPETVIALCRAYGRSPVAGLIQTEYINDYELHGPDVEIALREATNEQLLNEIMRRSDPEARYLFGNEGDEETIGLAPHLTPVSDAHASLPDEDDGTVMEWDDSIPHAADSSPDEQAEREKRGEDLID